MRNKVHNIDCLIGIERLDDKSIDLMVTDPPYLFDNGNWKNSQVVGKRAILKSGPHDPFGEVYTDMSEFGEEDINRFLDAVKPKMKVFNSYICCSETQVPLYGMWARKNGLHFSILVWEKPLSVICKNRFSTNLEYIVRIYDYGTGLNKLDNNELYNKVARVPLVRDKQHPTQKPVSLMERYILLSSNEGDLVLDPFCGSGTTAVACVRTKRDFIAFEKNEKFFKVAQRRVSDERSQLTLF